MSLQGNDAIRSSKALTSLVICAAAQVEITSHRDIVSAVAKIPARTFDLQNVPLITWSCCKFCSYEGTEEFIDGRVRVPMSCCLSRYLWTLPNLSRVFLGVITQVSGFISSSDREFS